MNPTRIQLSRKRGWKKPANTIVVSRPSKWGNTIPVPPHSPERKALAHAVTVNLYAASLELKMLNDPKLRARIERELRGKNLACWCPINVACHADILLQIANRQS